MLVFNGTISYYHNEFFSSDEHMRRALTTPPKMTLGLTEACPLRCRHCYADCAADPKPGELGLGDWLQLVDEVIKDGVIQFYIEGGEPLAKPGILDLLAHCA